MLPDMDDVVLGGLAMDMLAQADDILLLSLSARGLQQKLDALSAWCSTHFIVVSRLKTVVIVYGLSPLAVIPEFTVGTVAIALSTSEKYVGVTFQAQNAAPFSEHYKGRAQAA